MSGMPLKLSMCFMGFGLLVPAMGMGFLQVEEVDKKDADEMLIAELLGEAGNSTRLAELEAALRPTFNSVPKKEGDLLGHQVVRYILHRFFVQRHGWFIKGLEPGGDVFQANPMVTSKQPVAWVPSYLQDRLEERLGGRGLNLHELAALAASLEDLVRKEGERRLKDIYEVIQLPTSGTITKKQAKEAISTYLMIYLVGRNVSISSPREAEWKRNKFAQKYKGFFEADTWLAQVEDHHLQGENAPVDFSTTTDIVQEIGERYGSFNDLECKDLKSTLMTMESRSKKAGRVRLADFYNMSLYSHWKFTEKVEYLRSLGALDETDASQTYVLVPNYVMARPNCLEATSLYAVCCRNECEDLMGHLERTLSGPSASSARIAELVAALPSDTTPAPRKLSSALLRRLEQMAELHGGEVNLHGRLFAQWMHHAYPHECPYPHEAGTTNPETADAWMQRSGHADSQTTDEERRKVVEDACSADNANGAAVESAEETDAELPWSDAEELLTVHTVSQKKTTNAGTWLAIIFLMVAIVAVFTCNLKQFNITSEQQKVAVLCLLALLAYLTDLLDYSAFIVCPMIVAMAFAARTFIRPCEPVSTKMDKMCDKSFV